MREILWLKEAEDELATMVDYVLQNQGQNVSLYISLLFFGEQGM